MKSLLKNLSIALVGLSSVFALAQDYPVKPFVVENRPGGGGMTATSQLVKLPADGYTLMMGDTSQLGIAPHIFKNLPYDTFKDLTPISGLTYEPLLLVANAKTGIKTLQDLVKEVPAVPKSKRALTLPKHG